MNAIERRRLIIAFLEWAEHLKFVRLAGIQKGGIPGLADLYEKALKEQRPPRAPPTVWTPKIHVLNPARPASGRSSWCGRAEGTVARADVESIDPGSMCQACLGAMGLLGSRSTALGHGFDAIARAGYQRPPARGATRVHLRRGPGRAMCGREVPEDRMVDAADDDDVVCSACEECARAGA